MDVFGITLPLQDPMDAERLMLIILGGLVLWAAITDFRKHVIPNAVCAIIAVSGIAWQVFYVGHLQTSLIIAAIMLCLGFLASLNGKFGAGDAKLIAALILWAGPQESILFLAYTFMAGGFVSLAWIKFHPFRISLAAAGLVDSIDMPRHVPFALPIAIGTGLMIFRIWPGA